MPSTPYLLLLVLLPVTWLGFVLLGRLGSRTLSLGWLTVCAVCAFGFWSPVSLLLISAPLGVDYVIALAIRRAREDEESGKRTASLLFMVGVAANLLYLGTFKYWSVLVAGVVALPQAAPPPGLALPLGISFITFRAIAFLTDVKTGKANFDFVGYAAFVFFFADLTAGPIVHYREVMPQFEKMKYLPEGKDVYVGFCLLSIGLFKKAVCADGLEGLVTPIYGAAAQGGSIDALSSWIGALGYSFEIYFDFSGYSDIAIGIARLCGIRLPLNFNSPFKASNIIDFWSRWHMTLSRFLNTYVYMPVMLRMTSSRTRRGKPMMSNKRLRLDAFASVVMAPTLLTMFLSGLWHGTNPTFLLWGLLHGAYLGVNQAWRAWRPRWDVARYDRVMVPLGYILTFLSVAIAIVIFRSSSVAAALNLLRAMAGLGTPAANVVGNLGGLLGGLGIGQGANPEAAIPSAVLLLSALWLISIFAPNSQELLRDLEPALDYPPKKSMPTPGNAAEIAGGWRALSTIRAKLSPGWAIAFGALFILGCLGLRWCGAFIYWGF